MRGAFVRSWWLMGMENLMVPLYADPEFVRRVATLVTDYSLKQLNILAKSVLDVPEVEDDIANTQAPAYFAFTLLFLFYMFDDIDRLVIVSRFPFLKSGRGLTDIQCVLLVSAVYWPILIVTIKEEKTAGACCPYLHFWRQFYSSWPLYLTGRI